MYLQPSVHDSYWFTPFRKGLFNLFELCGSSPKLVKNFTISRHNVYEHIPMYGTWYINVICITFGVKYSLNSNSNVISHILPYLLHYCFKMLPHLGGDIYRNCILMYISSFSQINWNYKYNEYHIWWRKSTETVIWHMTGYLPCIDWNIEVMLPHLVRNIYWNCISMYIGVFLTISIEIWMQVIPHFVKNTCWILTLTYFDIFAQQCMIHWSIYHLV